MFNFLIFLKDGTLYTGWRRPIGCLKLQIVFRKRVTNHRALLRKKPYNDKASCGSSPPCSTKKSQGKGGGFQKTNSQWCCLCLTNLRDGTLCSAKCTQKKRRSYSRSPWGMLTSPKEAYFVSKRNVYSVKRALYANAHEDKAHLEKEWVVQ